MREAIKTHIKENIKEYMLLFFLLIIGIFFGVFIVNNTSNSGKTEIMEYINSFCNDIQNGKIQYIELLKELCKQDIILLIIMLIISFTFFSKIGVCTIIGYKGFEIRVYNIMPYINLWNSKGNSIFNLPNNNRQINLYSNNFFLIK